jgi:Ca-activated chloride channel family protein
MTLRRTFSAAAVALALIPMIPLIIVSLVAQEAVRPPDEDGAFRFKSGVELINVTTTVSDARGRFVSGLRKEDFVVYEDGRPVELTHFSAERVPVSLGIVLDTSGSMDGAKIRNAKAALSRFLYDLLDKEDEIFVYGFSTFPTLLQDWTSDRRLLSRVIYGVSATGGTAMYDAVAEAVPVAQEGQFRKKALLVISDGNDSGSRTNIRELKQQIRESEVLVYAIGIDGESEPPTYRRAPTPQPRFPIPLPPFPVPGGRRPFPQIFYGQNGRVRINPSDDRVDVSALRDMTDDSGGRTEVIRDGSDIDPATASIADELSKQYYLGYQASGEKDGRWHSIRVEVKTGRYIVRARKGYMAS